tara:strand:+ start:9754 stop:10530 length:777 start_codon:yes stop_codon:yes gene_type:complete
MDDAKQIAAIGHNNPPEPTAIERAKTVIGEISDWMADHPTIETEEHARAAKPYVDRARAALAAVETERDEVVRPLNEQVKDINAKYKAVHNTDKKKPALFDKVLNELLKRVQVFMVAEEDKRKAAAEAARKIQEEAERKAREAEAAEAEALANAKVGEVVDVAAVTEKADEAFAEYQQQSRFAARAEKDAHLKLAGGAGRTVSLRTKETLVLDDMTKALLYIGRTEKIVEAILSEARAYRNQYGELPDGVSAIQERVL